MLNDHRFRPSVLAVGTIQMPVSPEVVGVDRTSSDDEPEEPDCAKAAGAAPSIVANTSDVTKNLRIRDSPSLHKRSKARSSERVRDHSWSAILTSHSAKSCDDSARGNRAAILNRGRRLHHGL